MALGGHGGLMWTRLMRARWVWRLRWAVLVRGLRHRWGDGLGRRRHSTGWLWRMVGEPGRRLVRRRTGGKAPRLIRRRRGVGRWLLLQP
ncbi:MAG: hypothetical protein ACRDT8_17880, partial [Micromonosporaceae bacterium]